MWSPYLQHQEGGPHGLHVMKVKSRAPCLGGPVDLGIDGRIRVLHRFLHRLLADEHLLQLGSERVLQEAPRAPNALRKKSSRNLPRVDGASCGSSLYDDHGVTCPGFQGFAMR